MLSNNPPQTPLDIIRQPETPIHMNRPPGTPLVGRSNSVKPSK
jgi:hypothetical protein